LTQVACFFSRFLVFENKRINVKRAIRYNNILGRGKKSSAGRKSGAMQLMYKGYFPGAAGYGSGL
jgi:hypothetical protein